MALEPPAFADIVDAAAGLRGRSVVTPLIRSAALDAAVGARVAVKAETLQVSGSFKYRGAFTAIARLPEAQRRRGVVAYSSGNHAKAVATAARDFGCPATIVMPTDAPAAKVAGTRAAGAEIVTYDRRTDDREAIARRIAEETGRPIIHPYDHPDTIAGQGTVGSEIADQCRQLGLAPDAVLVPCSGGGLIAGIALALEAKLPAARCWAVEPEAYDDTRRSLDAGERRDVPTSGTSICDSLQSPMPGELTFAVNRRLLAGALTVSDAEVLGAMRFAFEELKLVVEPGGAVALAALLTGALDEMPGKRPAEIVVVCSGANVDPAMVGRALSAPPVSAPSLSEPPVPASPTA